MIPDEPEPQSPSIAKTNEAKPSLTDLILDFLLPKIADPPDLTTTIFPKSKTAKELSPEIILTAMQLLTESSEHVTNRRQGLNNYFLTLNTGLLGGIGWLFSTLVTTTNLAIQKVIFVAIIAGIGVFLCYLWLRFLRSYNIVSQSKISVVKQAEEALPIKVFSGQYLITEDKRTRYEPLTRLEAKICIVFGLIHVTLLLSALAMLTFTQGIQVAIDFIKKVAS